MRAKLSFLGLLQNDPDLFQDLKLPAAISKETFINNLIIESADLSVWITDPEIMRLALKEWSSGRIDIWEHLWDTTRYVYNPIWNKDGIISETETRDLKGSLKTETKNDVAAYNTDQMAPASEQNSESGSTDTGTVTRVRKEQGNIGITTTQQMIKEEREISDFSLMNLIMWECIQKFCIMVY